MSTAFSIHSDVPSAITTSASQPEPAKLTLDEVRVCFPARIELHGDDHAAVVLEDAPLIGVMVEIAECWERLKGGALTAEVVDFYGEYKLMFRVVRDRVECVNEFSGDICQAPYAEFVTVMREWVEKTFAQVEQRFEGIANNADYQRLNAFVRSTWGDHPVP